MGVLFAMCDANQRDPVIAIAQVSHMIQACFSDKDLTPKELHSIILKECARYRLGLNSVDYLTGYLTGKMCNDK
jgi:hypothetical protein